MQDETTPRHAQGHVDVNRWPAVLSAIILGTVGVLSFIIQPGIVQAYVTQLELDEAAAVDLAGIEMLGVAMATVFMAVRGHALNWRNCVVGGLLVAVLGNFASVVAGPGTPFEAARFATGLGEGVITSISFTFVGVTIRAERNVALYLTLLLAYGAFGLWYLPQFVGAFELGGLFSTFGIISLLALGTVFFVPVAYDAGEMVNPQARQLPRRLLVVALAGVLAYNLAQGIAWAVLFLVGIDTGMAEQAVADALFLSQIFAIGGALASVFLADHIGRNRAIAIGILGGGASIALLIGRPGPLVFTIGVCGFNLLWNFVLPFILGQVCDFDETGRMMSYAIALQMIGLGAGPIVAARLLEASGYRAAELVCVALFVASYTLLLGPMRRHRALSAPARLAG